MDSTYYENPSYQIKKCVGKTIEYSKPLKQNLLLFHSWSAGVETNISYFIENNGRNIHQSQTLLRI